MLPRALPNKPLQLAAPGLRIPVGLSRRGGVHPARVAAAERRSVSHRPVSAELTYADVVFKHLGFDVEPIPTGKEARADWKVTVGAFVLLVEEKLKLDDPEMIARRRAALDGGQVFPTHVPIKPDNRLSGITRKAATQIVATAPHVPHDFRIVWFTAAGRLHEPKQMQYVATLYGSTNIFSSGSRG